MLITRGSGAKFIALLLVFAIVGTTNYGVAQTKPETYNGETLYRGLFFASGPVAAKIPTVQRVERYLPPEYKALEDKVVQHIKSTNPTFFPNFEKEIQSGDHLRVAAAISQAAKLS